VKGKSKKTGQRLCVLSDYWDPMRSWRGADKLTTRSVILSGHKTKKDRTSSRMDLARVTEFQSQKYWPQFFSTLDDLCFCDSLPEELEECFRDLFLNFFSDYAQIDFNASRVRQGWKRIPDSMIKEVDRFRNRTKGLIVNKSLKRKIEESLSFMGWFAWNLDVGINGLPANKRVTPRNKPRNMSLRQFFVWHTNGYQKFKTGKFMRWSLFKVLIEDHNYEMNSADDVIQCSERTYRRLKKEFISKKITRKVP